MKNRWTLPALTLCFLLFLTACGGPAQTSSDPGTFYNTETGTELTLGMTREEVEKLLPAWGEPPPEEFLAQALYWPMMYGSTPEDVITVYYDSKTDTVMQIQMDKGENTGALWSLDGGVTVGSPLEKILEVYGTAPYQMNLKQTFLSYVYDAEGQLLGEDGGEAAYSVSFVLNETGLESCCVMSTAFDSKPVEEPSA